MELDACTVFKFLLCLNWHVLLINKNSGILILWYVNLEMDIGFD